MSTDPNALQRIRDPAGFYPLPDDPSPQTPYRASFGVGAYPAGSASVIESPAGIAAFLPGTYQGEIDVPTGVDARNITIENFYPGALDFQAGASYFKIPPYTVMNVPIDITYLKTLESLRWQFHMGTGTSFQSAGPQWRGAPLDGRTAYYTLNDNTFQPYSIFDRGVLRPVKLAEAQTAFNPFSANLLPIYVRDKLFGPSSADKSPEFWVHGLEIDYYNIPPRTVAGFQLGAVYQYSNPNNQTLFINTGLRLDSVLRLLPMGSGSMYVETPGLIGITWFNDWNVTAPANGVEVSVTAWTLYD